MRTMQVPGPGSSPSSASVVDAARRAGIGLVRSTNFASVLLDATFHVIWASPFANTLFGIGQGQGLGVSALDFCHPDDLAEVSDMLAREFMSPAAGDPSFSQRYVLDLRLKGPGGEWLELEVSATNMFDDPDVNGFLLQLQRPAAQRQRLRSLVAAARGDDLTVVLGTLLRSFSTGGPREQQSVMVDASGVVVASVVPGVEVGSALRDDPTQLAALARWSVDITYPTSGECCGSLIVWNSDPPIHPFDRRAANEISGVAGVLLEQHRLRAQLVAAAHTDDLTGLANRAAFRTRLAELAAAGADVGVVFVDVDHFKSINDRYGHAFGDDVLRGLSDRLASIGVPGAFVARLGGDEFAILVDPDLAAIMGHCVVDAMREPLVSRGYAIAVSVSVGVSSGRASAADELLLLADASMFVRKEARSCGPSERHPIAPSAGPDPDAYPAVALRRARRS